jgi:hypothetical protein
MTLRCKVGDVVRVVSSSSETPENVGRYLLVKEALGEVTHGQTIDCCPDGCSWWASASGMQWWCEGAVSAVWQPTGAKAILQAGMFADCELQPIRPTNAPDEIIERIGKPVTHPLMRETEQQ